VTQTAKAWGEWHGGRDGGAIQRFARVGRDGTLPLVRQITSSTLDFKRWTRINEFQAYPETGDAEAIIEMQISRDRGKTWSDPKPRQWSVGEYARQVTWRGLGVSRQATFRLTMSGQADVTIRALASVE
jgi:hypothetical protein